MFEIITFGSATWDIYLKMEKEQLLKTDKVPSGTAVGFDLGAKVDINDMYFSFGGGGMNTAHTFKKQGFKVAYCGSVGSDIPGKEIIAEMEGMGIGTEFIQKNEKPTNNSIILLTSDNERTVLAYRGASEDLNKEEILWGDMSPSWFYLAPLSGKLRELTEDIVDFAKKNKIKVAINLGNSQIVLGKEKLEPILKKADVLLLNLEEASLLTGVDKKDEMGIMRELNSLHPGINTVTKGPEGVLVSEEDVLIEASSYKVKVVDKTGAGDAFGSGFISGLIKSNMDVEWAIKLGIANSISCIQIRGAINGLLEGSDDLIKIGDKIKIERKKII
ncbi:MAG: carbohydrate kinase family protein [Candidatus Paceibacterota bacterium]|jgi:sugar/nucleoside kinase (ribokinase family)